MTAAASGRTPASAAPERASAWTLPVACVAVAAIGAWLRLDQFARQVLIDDEWHAVHQVLARGPAAFVLDLGHADYGIPLALYDWLLVHTVGLSETAMRLPMMAAGLATVALLPLAVASRLGREAALAFALLLAISPPLVAYSQIARPYALDVLAGWFAHWAFQRWWAGSRGHGAGYAAAVAFAAWTHVVVAPFALAPFAWAGWQVARDRAVRRTQGRRLVALGVAVAIALGALLGPPLWMRPAALAAKSGFDAFDAATVGGALYWWLGTRSTVAVIVVLALAAIGMPRVWRLPEARTGALGVALTAIALAIARPEWGSTTLVFGRYLMPVVPLLLCAAACGATLAGAAMAGNGRHRVLGAGVATIVVAAALAASGPLRDWMRHPTSYRLALVQLYDFRAGPNAARETQSLIPMSPFWQTLADRPPGSILVAAAPFRFESYDWDGPRWERKSRQRVIPGWLTGLCVDWRPGELPAREGFAFRNAVRLADRAALASRGVDWVVWQKPWVPLAEDRLERGGDRVAQCESALRDAFGPPAYEDGQVVAFRLAPGGADARR